MADAVVSMDVRLAVAFFVQVDTKVTVKAFCVEHDISRQTYYKLRRRFQADGLEGLVPQSRRPRSSPSATSVQMIAVVIQKRLWLQDEGWDSGPVSVRSWLLREGIKAPSVSTIYRIVRDHAMVEPQPKKRPRSSFRRFAATSANERWQIDGMKWRLAGGTPAVVLRIQDDCSRRVMATRACWAETTADAWQCLQMAMVRHGRPAVFLSDGGSAWTQRRRLKPALGEFEARLRLAGILPVVSSSNHPQTCGKKEREWQTLQRWLNARPAAADLPELQRLLDAYDMVFNHDRPHQAHAGKTPAERYDAAPRMSASDTPLAAPMDIGQVKVRRNGVVDLGRGAKTSIGVEWAHTTVTVMREDPAVAIFHHDELIRFIHLDPDRAYQLRNRR